MGNGKSIEHICAAFESESNDERDEKKTKFEHKRIAKMFSEDDEGMESF